jgi:hypothetical protein
MSYLTLAPGVVIGSTTNTLFNTTNTLLNTTNTLLKTTNTLSNTWRHREKKYYERGEGVGGKFQGHQKILVFSTYYCLMLATSVPDL